jgi:hypothetical protein
MKSGMSDKELGQLAMMILNTAEMEDDEAEDGYIRVDSDLLFRYFVMGGGETKRKKSKKKKEAV